MAKCSGSSRELKKIKNICAKASKKHESSNISSSISDSGSSLSSDSEWDERVNPTKLKEMNKLDHVVTNNI